jgi:hypothetical protein
MRTPLQRVEREVARLSGFDFGFEGSWPLLVGSFNYDGGGQGLGCSVSIGFLKRFLAVFRVDSLREVNGRACWVTHTDSSILLLEPLLPDEGEPFNIEAWWERKARKQERRESEAAVVAAGREWVRTSHALIRNPADPGHALLEAHLKAGDALRAAIRAADGPEEGLPDAD